MWSIKIINGGKKSVKTPILAALFASGLQGSALLAPVGSACYFLSCCAGSAKEKQHAGPLVPFVLLSLAQWQETKTKNTETYL